MPAGLVLDLLVVLGAGLAAWGGYRLGFLRRLPSWIGLAIGVVLATAFLPSVVSRLSAMAPGTRVAVALAFVIGLALAGQGAGMLLGDALRANVTLSEQGQRVDVVAGAVLGVVGVLVAVWMLAPALSAAPGWSARAARGSLVVRTVNEVAPRPPATLVALGRLVAEAPFPDVFEQLSGSPKAGTPPTAGLPAAVDATVRASVVKVESEACDRIQDGSGWVVGPGEVVTNAHVVAGERNTTVITSDGVKRRGRVVAFDPRRDLAVVRVDGLDRPPLLVVDGEVGDTGVVYGFPGGGGLRPAPARIAQEITAVGRDLYGGGGVRRDVYVLAADLRPGDSGGAMVDDTGSVVGVAFAVDPGNRSTAYALSSVEVRGVLTNVRADPVGTGPCLVG